MIIKEIAQAIPVERKLIKYPTTSDLRAQRKAPQICYPMGTGRGIEWEERRGAESTSPMTSHATPGTFPQIFLLHKECFGLVSLPTTSHNAFELSAGHSRWKQIGITIDYGFRCVDRRGSVILHAAPLP